MHPFVPHPPVAGGAAPRDIQALLRAAASLGRDEQPLLYRHVHPHGHATARLARSFAAAKGCAGALTLGEIELGAHLHDFGKYLIAESVLLRPGPLTDAEREVVSLHPVYGAHILCGLPAVTEAVRRMILYHHEHWDG